MGRSISLWQEATEGKRCFKKWGGHSSVEECLLSKHEALGSIPSVSTK